MKFNCGPTKEAKTDMREAEAERIWNEGLVVFAWLPVRVGEKDCRWMEKVKKVPHPKSYSRSYHTGKSAFVFSYKYKYGLDWKYEAIQPK